jgi:hypothetical protein
MSVADPNFLHSSASQEEIHSGPSIGLDPTADRSFTVVREFIHVEAWNRSCWKVLSFQVHRFANAIYNDNQYHADRNSATVLFRPSVQVARDAAL